MITEDYVSFETARLLKEKGFPQQRMEFVVTTRDCLFIVNGNQKVKECAGTELPYYPYSKLFLYEEDWAVLPTLQMAMKWLREVHKLHIGIVRGPKGYHITIETIPLGVVKYITREIIGTTYVDSYEQACEAALKYCLENLI